MVEEWRVISDFPAYKISNLGRVRRFICGLKNHKCRILKPYIGNHGYSVISLVKNKIHKKFLIHRLVCEAFHGKPPTKQHQVAHNDGTRTNHNADNLRWATRSENMEDSRLHGTMAIGSKHGRTVCPEKNPRGEKHGHSKLKNSDIKNIRAFDNYRGSGVYLASIYKVSTATISIIRSGKIWKHL